MTQVLRQSQQAQLLGVSRWTLGRIAKTDPTFPAERQISEGVTGRLADELDQWLRSRPLAKTGAGRWRKPGQAAE